MSNILVVYGGPNGIIVYNLEDTYKFLHQPLCLGNKNHIIIKKDSSTYNFATFSHDGRYLAVIKDLSSVEVLDLHRETSESIGTPLSFNLGLTHLHSSPAFLSFSPRSNFIAISYISNNNQPSDQNVTSSLVKVYDFTT
jgi:hypothetical protein